MDDGCAAVNTVAEAVRVLQETRASLGSFNIHLHKIISNSPEVLAAFPQSELGKFISSKDFDHSENQRILGVEWQVASDEFVVRTNIPNKPYTKRGCLSMNNSLYDPFGLVAPVLLKGRILQRTFLTLGSEKSTAETLGWDDPLPESLRPLWEEWIKTLRDNDSTLKIPRGFLPSNFGEITDQSVHVFSDASLEGTGFVMYLRTVNTNGNIHVAFLMGNSRIAPQKAVSVPRLELCAALEASQATVKVLEYLSLPSDCAVYYTDSLVVIGYLNNTVKRFRRYVTTRVDAILKITKPEHWRYVPTIDNPADLASRPQTIESLLESAWLRGPVLLYEEHITTENVDMSEVELPEAVEIPVITLKTTTASDVLMKLTTDYSSLSKLVGVVKRVLDFLHLLRERVMRRKGISFAGRPPTSGELAIEALIRSAQGRFFPAFKDLNSLPENLHKLCPYIDDKSIIRVGGRLTKSTLSESQKHPILIPHQDPLTTLVIHHYHLSLIHI